MSSHGFQTFLDYSKQLQTRRWVFGLKWFWLLPLTTIQDKPLKTWKPHRWFTQTRKRDQWRRQLANNRTVQLYHNPNCSCESNAKSGLQFYFTRNNCGQVFPRHCNLLFVWGFFLFVLFVCCVNVPTTCTISLSDRSAQTCVHAATLRRMLHTELAISLNQNTLTPGQTVLAMSLYHQTE